MNIVPTLARAARAAATRRACVPSAAPRSLYTAAAFRPSPIAMAKSKKRNRFEEEDELDDEGADDLFGSMPVSAPISSNAKPRAAPTAAPVDEPAAAGEADAAAPKPKRVRDYAAEAQAYEEAVQAFTASLEPKLTLAGVGPKLLPLRTAIDNANSWAELENILALMRTYTRRWRPVSEKVIEAFAQRACRAGYPEIALNEYLAQHASQLSFTPARLRDVQRALAAKLSGPAEAILESATLPGAPEEKPEAAAEGNAEADAGVEAEAKPAAEADPLDAAKASIVNRMLLTLALSHATPDASLIKHALKAHEKLTPTPARQQRSEELRRLLAEVQSSGKGLDGEVEEQFEFDALPEVIPPAEQRANA